MSGEKGIRYNILKIISFMLVISHHTIIDFFSQSSCSVYLIEALL